MRTLHFSLRQANNLLFALIVLLNGYVIAAPAWPRLSFWWRANHSSQQAQLTQAVHSRFSASAAANQATGNSLIIPTMLLHQTTLEAPKGDWFNALKQGIWRWPDSSTPDRGGNTVLLAHRFSYTGPHGAFYFLDKLRPGDEIALVWDFKKYVYTVLSSRQVPPSETSIEDNTPDARLTLFTCAPLWHPVNRLVVVATLKAGS